MKNREIILITITDRDKKRFARFSQHDGRSGCINWIGTRTYAGYGQFRWRRWLIQAHRFAYWIAKGDIPPKYVVHHLCENRACVNPAHLEALSYSIHNWIHKNGSS